MTLLLSNTESGISQAVEILKNGGIVALPTETVYGLAADASNPQAIAKIFAAKNRPTTHPLILHVASFAEISKYAMQISNASKLLAKTFWPGPLSLVFEKNENVGEIITGGKTTVVIRCPKNEIFRQVLQAGNFALVAPSANIHKKLSPTKASHVLSQMHGLIDAILDGGTCEVGVESTIVDARSDVKILRSGPVSQSQIEEVLGRKIEDFSALHTNNVSGSMKVHYQPNKPVKLVDFAYISNLHNNSALNLQTCAFLCFSEEFFKQVQGKFQVKFEGKISSELLIKLPQNALLYGASLYDSLHKLQSTNASEILIETPPQSQEWLPICDKLTKMVAQ